MLSAYDIGTPNPVRTTSIGGFEVEKKDFKRNTRENVGIIFLITISLAILFSSICIFKYSLRARAVYDELVDYLDKTVSISKINYNPVFGVYELRPNELEILGEERKYKSLIWTFLFCDLVCFIFFGISAFFYFSVEYSRGLIRVLFWLSLLIGLLYSLIESTTFAVLISPYSTKLPNSTISLMDHAIPHNPGGLAQMESRFGCIFDQNLYETFKRQFNPKNTCDPFLLSSFIPNFLLICFIVIRGLAILIFVTLLLTPNGKISITFSRWAQRMKPAIHYQKNMEKSKKAHGLPPYYNSPTKTTFGVKDQHIISSPLPTHIPPITPPLGQMDHTISYNNAALFAISGANVNYGMENVTAGKGPSSRCSEISIAKSVGENFMQQDLMLRGSTHTTNSLVSEV